MKFSQMTQSVGNCFKQRFVPMYHGFLNKIRVAFGNPIVINDASDEALAGLKIFGKSTQNGTPTPDAPVEIVSVKNSIVRSCNKNLLPVNDIEFEQHVFIPIGITCEAGIYSFSAIIESEDTDSEQCAVMFYADNDRDVVKSLFVNRSVDGKRIWFKTNVPRAFRYIRLYTSTGWNESSGDTARFSDIMLDRETEQTDYEPYIDGGDLSLPYTLRGIPVSSDGNYTDANGQQWICDEVDFERGVYIQRVGELSSYDNESISTLYISTTGALTVGATVLYQLKTPIETPLTADQIEAYKSLHTNKPNTTISNDQNAWMEVKYISK